MDDIVRRGDEGGQVWERIVERADLRGVDATRIDAGAWTWQIFVSVAEFLRQEPLESEMRQGIDRALRSLPSVAEVHEEDREVWLVQGDSTGPELIRAVATVVDALADRAEAHLDEL